MTKLSAAEDFALCSPQQIDADIAQAWRDAGIETSAPTAEEIAEREARWIAEVLARNPQIGILQTAAGVRYYAYLNGYDAEPTYGEGSAGLSRLAALLVQF